MANKLASILGKNKNTAEDRLQDILIRLNTLSADIPAVYDAAISEVVADIEAYKRSASELIRRLQEGVSLRNGRVSSIEAQKDELLKQIEEANTRFGEALAAGNDAEQARLLDELQGYNARILALDGLVASLSSGSFSLSAEDLKLVQTLRKQAGEIADKIDHVNELYRAIAAAMIPFDNTKSTYFFRKDYFYDGFGGYHVEHIPEVSSARLMPRCMDVAQLPQLEAAVTLGDVQNYLSGTGERITSDFGRPADHFLP